MTQPVSDSKTGKIILVTGAASGIGAATVHYLRNEGATVIGWDRQASENSGTVDSLVDVTDEQSISKALASLIKEHGRLDGVAHAAGILTTGSLLDQPMEDIQYTFNVNTFGTLNICRATATVMRTQHSGAIVVVSSNSAGTPRVGMGAYGASKSAINSLVKTLGLELAADGIRCNLVSPGSTLTTMQTQFWQANNLPVKDAQQQVIMGQSDQFRLGIPLAKLAHPEDIAASIAFLLSDQARHITLENLVIDGGATLGARG